MEFSMETPNQEKSRLAALEVKATPAEQLTLVDGVKSALPNLYPDHNTNPGSALLAATNDPNADPDKVAEITAAADEKYLVKTPVKPLDHGHVQAKQNFDQDQIDKITNDKIVERDAAESKKLNDSIEKYNSDPSFKRSEIINEINKTKESQATVLLQDIERAESNPSAQIDILASKDPLYFARDKIRSLAETSKEIFTNRIISDLEDESIETYLKDIKKLLIDKGAKSGVVDIIISETLTKAEKAEKLKLFIR